jgi:hypothetical protein
MARTTALGTADAAKWVHRQGALVDATARNDQHEYVDRSLRETERVLKQPSGVGGPSPIGSQSPGGPST